MNNMNNMSNIKDKQLYAKEMRTGYLTLVISFVVVQIMMNIVTYLYGDATNINTRNGVIAINIIAVLAMGLIFYFSIVYVHEKGHVYAAKVTSKRYGYKYENLGYRIFSPKYKIIPSPKTTTDWYKFLEEHREEPEWQEVIKENAIAGIEAEKRFGRFTLVLYIIAVVIYVVTKSFSCFVLAEGAALLAAYSYAAWQRKHGRNGAASNDIRFYENPSEFVYTGE